MSTKLSTILAATLLSAATTASSAHADGVIQRVPGSATYKLGESPVWDHKEKCLYFADIDAPVPGDVGTDVFANNGKIFRSCPAHNGGAPTLVTQGFPAYSLHRHKEGGFVAGGSSADGSGALYWVDDTMIAPTLQNGGVRVLATVPGHVAGTAVFVNEAVVTPSGGMYFGTVVIDFAQFPDIFVPGRLYHVPKNATPGAAAVEVYNGAPDGILGNGLGLSPNGRTLYWAVSVDRAIYAFRVNHGSGALTPEGTFASLSEPYGFYDGLTVNSAGHVLAASWFEGKIRRYDHEGNALGSIDVSEDSQVSNVTYGGNDLEDLYITTSSAATNPLFTQLTDFQAPDLVLNGFLYVKPMSTPGQIEHRAKMPLPAAPCD